MGVIVLFSALYTDLDNIAESSGDVNMMGGLKYIVGKIVARTFYTVLQEVLIKNVVPAEVDDIVKIQVFNFYDFWVCLVLAMVWWPDYSIVWGTSGTGWIFDGYSWGAFLVPMAEASYSFISLQVLAKLTGEALSIAQGFALVILWCFNLILNSARGKHLKVTFTSVFAILGVACTITLYAIAVEQDKIAALKQKLSSIWHPMNDALPEVNNSQFGGSVTTFNSDWEESYDKTGKGEMKRSPKSRQDKVVPSPANFPNYVSPLPLSTPGAVTTSSLEETPEVGLALNKIPELPSS